jgi:YYY domain-containing protein
MTLASGSVPALLIWYAALLGVGAAAFPIAFGLFPRLNDRGFGFSRVLGLALATYLLMLVVTLRAAPNGRRTALACAGVLALAGAAAFFGRRRQVLVFLREKRRRLILSEAVFAFGFLFFLAFRALAPEIYWGEKPMDFSILNILVRTSTLPASDPWFAGAPLRYYTFGHQALAWLSQVTGLSTRFTFNLAFGLLGGATLQGMFALLAAWTGTLRAGFLGAAMTALLGNLSGLREWLVFRRPKHEPLNWHYFWATSRVVPATVNEYPLWSFLFADLHAHVIAIPFFLVVAACALELVRAHADSQSPLTERLAAAALLGFAAAAQVLTNAWDAPLLAGLLLLLPIVLAAAPGLSLRSGLRALVSGMVSLGVAGGTAWPLWPRGSGSPGFGKNWEPTPPGIEVVNVFGLFFFLAFGWWLVACAAKLEERGKLPGARVRVALLLGAAAILTLVGLVSPVALCSVGVAAFLTASFALAEQPEDRLAFGFAGTAFFLIAFALRLFIYDRFNTIFKLFLESWLLLSIATAALVFGRTERRGAWKTWPIPLRAAASCLFALAAFTAVTGARGFVGSGRPMPPGVPTSSVTLDGLAYLERSRPGEYKAVLWLRDKVPGTPVILEAQGPGYQDFSRISMYTGLPTVVGWDPHVGQRGNPASEIASRRAAVDAIYTIPSAEAAASFLRRYHVGYVYVGWLERRTYPGAGLRKFDEAPQLFRLVYENPEARVYRVVGGDSQDVIAVHEPVPTPEAAATERSEPETQPSISETAAPDRLPFSGMREPRDGTVDGRGRLWIADFGNSRLRIFDGAGGYLGGWGGRGSGTWGFNQLCSVAIRGDRVYVADTWNGRIESFTLAGQRKAEAGDGNLYGPRGVAVTPDGRVWVCDTGNHRVIVYDAELEQTATFGKKGSGKDELDAPVGIASGSGGRIFVADSANRRIQILDGSGAFQGSWPVPGWTSACEPHLEADDDGRLYVADPTGEAVLVYDTAGRLESRITRDGKGQPFARPTGIAIAAKTRILYVINSGDSSVAIVPLPRRTGK